MTIPIFKSHYSIGKSILTLSPATVSARNGSASSDNDVKESLVDGPCSIFDIVNENDLKQIVLVEDSLIGFLQAQKVAKQLEVQLIYGVRFDVCEDASDEEAIKESKCSHKIIIFPKNGEGCKDLNKIYTESKTKYHNHLDMKLLKSLWNEDNLSLAIPFYDSSIFKNMTSFNSCVLSFSFTKPTFFTEQNGLPFDSIVLDAVNKYCKANKFDTQQTQSIYYKNKEDFPAYLTYKLICSRGSFASRQSSLEKPNFDHLGSDQFCWESYKEKYMEAL